MLSKVLVFVALVCQLASAKHVVSVDYVENVRNSEGAQSRIVSGWEASPGQIPFQVAVRAVDLQNRILGCGGSAIHQEWVITAAHCTANYRSVTILGGLTHIQSPEYVSETWEWYNYPTFNSNMPERVQTNDVALVKLTSPMVYSPNLQRIQIQSSMDAFREYSGEKLVASGWGRTWTGGLTSDVLLWVYLVGLDHFTCDRTFGSSGIVNSNTICARFYNVTSQSICQGDSGGPLVYTDSQGERILVGISSFVAGAASGGCHSGHPGGFIRPGPFHSWYQEVTGIDFENLDDSPVETTPAPTTTTVLPTTSAPTTTTTVPSTTTTTVPSTTTTTTPLPPTPEEEEVEEEEESDESDESDEDESVNKILKKLKISVKVKVNMKKYKTRNGKIRETIEEIQ